MPNRIRKRSTNELGSTKLTDRFEKGRKVREWTKEQDRRIMSKCRPLDRVLGEEFGCSSSAIGARRLVLEKMERATIPMRIAAARKKLLARKISSDDSTDA